jgi:hypothetical protein
MESKKRNRSNVVNVSDISNTSSNATVGGVVTVLSPMKKSRSCPFFDGKISDGRSSMRLFGFDPNARDILANYNQTKQPVVLGNCEIKPSRLSEDLEIFVTRKTEMEESAHEYDISDISDYSASQPSESTCDSKLIQLKDLDNLNPYDTVDVLVKVAELDEILKTKGGKSKQDIVIADATGMARFTVWEQTTGNLSVGNSYSLRNILVREYNNEKSLTTNYDQSLIEEIADIGGVFANPETSLISSSKSLNNVRIIGIIYLKQYPKCLKCNSKVVNSCDDDEIGKCTACFLLQTLDACDYIASAKMLIKSPTSVEPLTLLANTDIIRRIVNSHTVNPAALLKAL